MNNSDTTGSYSGNSASTTGTTSSTRSGRLPRTASELPTVALAGLLALAAVLRAPRLLEAECLKAPFRERLPITWRFGAR